MLNQQDLKKQIIHATLTYKNSFSNYLKYFLDDIGNETVERFDFFAHKKVEYRFYKLDDYLLLNGLNMVPMRNTKINKK